MTAFDLTRRGFAGAGLGFVSAAMLGVSARAQMALPKSPVALNIVDVAGNLALTKPAVSVVSSRKRCMPLTESKNHQGGPRRKAG